MDIKGLPKPFSKELPQGLYGASISDEDPAVTKNLTLQQQQQHSGAVCWRGDTLGGIGFLKGGREGVMAMIVWSSILFALLAGGVVGMF